MPSLTCIKQNNVTAEICSNLAATERRIMSKVGKAVAVLCVSLSLYVAMCITLIFSLTLQS